MSDPQATIDVRCPDPKCATVFGVEPARLGRNTRCRRCGIGMTARPLAIEEQLRRQEEQLADIESVAAGRLPFVVLVDGIRSLWNVGSIFRTADACNVRQLVLTGITGYPPRPEIGKTALGAEKAVAWRYRADAGQALAELVAEGYTPVAVERTPRAVALEELDWPERVCLVIGNEVAGVSPPVLEVCPLHARIQMLGAKDCLNVAVAFGIAAYHVSRVLAPATASTHETA